MKRIVYALIISILCLWNTSYPMQQSITSEKISLFICIAAGCGASLYIAHKYKDSILHWLTSLWRKKPISDLEKETAQYVQNKEKKEKQSKEGTTELHRACEENNIVKVRILLNDPSTDINAKRDCMTYCHYHPEEKHGETPLYIACQNQNKEIIDLLLSCKDLTITIGDRDKNTPLHIASKNSDLEVVQKLISYDKECINKQNRNNQSALYFSYLHKHGDITAFLLEQDTIDLTGILSLACERSDMKMINKLLRHKNIKFDDNYPLYIACKKGYSDIVILLLQHNKNNCMKINHLVYNKNLDLGYHSYLDRAYNPLHIACKQIKRQPSHRSKFVIIIQSLLADPHIDINKKNSTGFTVFHYAAANEEILRLLLAKDDRFINEQHKLKNGSSYQGLRDTPLHKAVKATNYNCIFLLLEHGAKISKKNVPGDTPFSLACERAAARISGYLYIVEKLLASDYVNQKIINSSDSLHRSIFKGSKKGISELLLTHGADPNKRINKKYRLGPSPLLEAAEYNLDLLNLCIDEYKGDYTQTNDSNQTIFFIAFMSKKIQNPNEINFFKNLSENAKKKFMMRELSIIASSTPQHVLTEYPRTSCQQDRERFKNNINLFYSFVESCICHGKIDPNAKLNTKISLLFDTAYHNLQERHLSFETFDQTSDRKRCMHPNKPICSYTHDKWNHKHYDGCDDCHYYFPYNELIVHALVRHITPTTIEQTIHKTIATTYKNESLTYYLKKQEEKENTKNCIREKLQKSQLSLTS